MCQENAATIPGSKNCIFQGGPNLSHIPRCLCSGVVPACNLTTLLLPNDCQSLWSKIYLKMLHLLFGISVTKILVVAVSRPLVSVIRALLSGISTPPACNALQLLDTLEPVLEFHSTLRQSQTNRTPKQFSVCDRLGKRGESAQECQLFFFYFVLSLPTLLPRVG